MAASSEISRRSALAAYLFLASKAMRAVEPGEPAPHFVAKTMDGERITSDALKGKVVLIEFWTTWCQYCKKDERAVESLTREFANSGLVVLAVNIGESRRKVQKYLDAAPRTAKVVLAESTTLAAICQANTYPLYVLIDRDSNIAGTQHGAAGEGALRRWLSKAGLEAA